MSPLSRRGSAADRIGESGKISLDGWVRFVLQTRFRVVARCRGNYAGKIVAESEWVAVESDSLSFQDYLDVRVIHLLLAILNDEGDFAVVFEHARQYGLKPADLIVRMQSRADQAPRGFRQNYDAPVDDSKGGNLLSKYSMLGWFTQTMFARDLRRKLDGDAKGVRLGVGT